MAYGSCEPVDNSLGVLMGMGMRMRVPLRMIMNVRVVVRMLCLRLMQHYFIC